MRTLRALIGAVVLCASLIVTGQPGGAQPGGSQARLASVKAVTLVTGDVVRLSTMRDGRQVAAVEPGGPGARHGYQLLSRDGESYVIPRAAAPLLAAGRLDEALFNVTALAADGYDDASRASLPLLISQPPGLAAPAVPAAATVRTRLSSVNAVAVTADKARAGELWASIATRGAGTVWLDRKVRATLSESVPQIGAPTAWAEGVDGTGVTVAVLDSGYDPTHPDLAGRVVGAADFTGEESTVDTNGHGTHVAATITGAGATRAKRVGVAPGARLLIGRVLDGTATGEMSWIMAGMEWAVAQGARVINMSFGVVPSDGTDLLSTTVDNLSRSSGALFVAAAGNTGPRAGNVLTPGAATEALTVGAVSKSDKLASFSGRGPRLGDGAVKPELTAPGVGIIAARAAGTAVGELIDARYTSLSSTSMAAPHVTGAAALLAQRHPDWRAAQLKAALVGGARPVDSGAPANALGAGRVDVPAALRSPILPDTSSVRFGHIEWTGDAREPRTATVGYRNISTAPVTLDLRAAASAPGSQGAALRVAPRRLTIQPGATGQAVLTLDPDATTEGAYTGQLVATGGFGAVRTPIGFRLDAQRYTLTVTALDRLGRPAGRSLGELWNLDTGESTLANLDDQGTTQVPVPPGRYSLVLFVYTRDENGFEREVTVAGDPELTITGDRTLRYDTRAATPIRVKTPQDSEIRSAIVAWQRVVGEHSLITGWNFSSLFTDRFSTLETAPVTVGTFHLVHHFELGAPMLTASVDGRNGYRLPNPLHIDGSPAVAGRHRLRVVDGKDGAPEQLAGARDAAVLVRFTGFDHLGGQLANAAAAGAAMVILHSDTGGFLFVTAFGATIPTYSLEKADAGPLLERLAGGVRTTLEVSGTPESPFSYQLHLPERDRIPAGRTYDTRHLRLARVDWEMHDTGGGGLGFDSRSAITDAELASFTAAQRIPIPLRRTDYLNTGTPDTEITWQHEVVPNLTAFYRRASMVGPPRTYRPGERDREVWFPAIIRPGIPPAAWPAGPADLAKGTPVNRAHDVLRVAMPQFASGDFEQHGWPDYSIDRTTLSLRRNGTPVASSTRPVEQFTVPGGAATYQLSLAVTRDQDDAPAWWTTSTSTATTWTFRSQRPPGDTPDVLPLLQIGYQLDTDLHNAVPARRPYRLVLRPGYQPGANQHARMDLRAEISYDDGTSWQRLPTRRGHDGIQTAWVSAPPRDARFATLRVSAWDTAGNRIDQTITRAWRL